MMVEPAAIRADAVSLEIGARRIVDSLDLEARTGAFLAIIGPNGAGKSTMLRLLASLMPVGSGAIYLQGRDLARMQQGEIARVIASVPQNTPVEFAFSAQEIVLMGRHPHLGRFSVEGEEDMRVAREAMLDTGTEEFAERSIVSLSGGERQLVFIAKALAQQPRVLLLDEPVSALDIRHQLDVLNLIRAQTDRGVASIAVLHDLNLAARFCDRLVLMSEGRMLSAGRPEEVLTEANLRIAYRVEADVRTDPATGAVSVTAIAVIDSALEEPMEERQAVEAS